MNRRGCLFLLVFCLRSAAASADTITITEGRVELDDDPRTPAEMVVFTGDRGFTFQGKVDYVPNVIGRVNPIDQCNHLMPGPLCLPGTTLGLEAAFGGTSIRGTATLEGITYPQVGAPDSANQLVTWWGGSVVLPPLAPTATLAAPFFLGPGPFGAPSFFSHAIGGSCVDASQRFCSSISEGLTGVGTATLFMSRQSLEGFPDSWRVDRVSYDFMSPVPEPATLLLVSGGAILLLLGRRRPTL
jgi:hypothetical protein